MKSPDIPVNLTSPLPSSWLLYRFDESIVQKAFEVLPCLKESYICDRVEDIRAAWYKHELKAIIFVIDKHDTSVEDWACRFSMALPEAPLILLSNESSVLDDAKLFELGIQDIWSLEELPSALFPKLVQHSITRKHVEYQTRHLAHYDALTGVANRTLFQDRLDHSLLHARREASVVSLLTIDLDRFSAVNEHYGHDIGDILLKQFAQRLSEVVRSSDTVARISGNCFVVLLEHVADEEVVSSVANKLCSAFNQPYFICGHEIFCSVSIGIEIASRASYESVEFDIQRVYG